MIKIKIMSLRLGWDAESNVPYRTTPNNDKIAYMRIPISKKHLEAAGLYLSETPVMTYTPYNIPLLRIDVEQNQKIDLHEEKINSHDEEIALLNNEINSISTEISSLDNINHWVGKTCYAYGTSITDVDAGTGKYLPYLRKLSKMNIIDKGIAGAGVTPDIGGYSKGQIKNALMNITDGKLNADLITIEIGANDGGAPLGTVYDFDNTTYAGCLNQCLYYLQHNTTAQIIVFASPAAKVDLPTENNNLWNLLKITEECCKFHNVHFFPRNNNMGFGRINGNNKLVKDNIHQTELGGFNQAVYMWSKIKTVPLFYNEIPQDEESI